VDASTGEAFAQPVEGEPAAVDGRPQRLVERAGAQQRLDLVARPGAGDGGSRSTVDITE
jgi:hypothetical protein